MYMYIRIHMYTHVYVYTCMYVCIYVCMYMYIIYIYYPNPNPTILAWGKIV